MYCSVESFERSFASWRGTSSGVLDSFIRKAKRSPTCTGPFEGLRGSSHSLTAQQKTQSLMHCWWVYILPSIPCCIEVQVSTGQLSARRPGTSLQIYLFWCSRCQRREKYRGKNQVSRRWDSRVLTRVWTPRPWNAFRFNICRHPRSSKLQHTSWEIHTLLLHHRWKLSARNLKNT